MERLKRRQDFLAAARSLSIAMPGLVLQLRPRGDEGLPRLGFTVTKKLGGAVQRNRSKRRLKEAARAVMHLAARPGNDYVVIGRLGTPARGFTDLTTDLETAVARLHAKL